MTVRDGTVTVVCVQMITILGFVVELRFKWGVWMERWGNRGSGGDLLAVVGAEWGIGGE